MTLRTSCCTMPVSLLMRTTRSRLVKLGISQCYCARWSEDCKRKNKDLMQIRYSRSHERGYASNQLLHQHLRVTSAAAVFVPARGRQIAGGAFLVAALL